MAVTPTPSSRLRTAPRRHALLVVAYVAFAVMALQYTTGLGGRTLESFDNRWTYDGVIVLGALYCLLCARRREERAIWVAVGVAIAAWAAGDIYYTVAFTGADTVPFPSLADVGYLLFYPPAYVGLWLLFRREVRGVVWSLWLDGAIAALITAALAASVVFEVVSNSLSGESTAAVATNLAYPLGDTILLAVVVGAVALSGWRYSPRWLLFGGGLVLFGVCDSIYLVQTATGTYVEGQLLDLGWPAGILLLASAGATRSRHVLAGQLEGHRLLAVPALFASIALTLEIVDHFLRLNPLGIALASAALAGVIVRMGMTFSDYVRLLSHTKTETVTDALTGLLNRRALMTDLERAAAAPTSSVLLLYDLNGFKSYNDRFGHPAGDALLVRLGSRLRSSLEGEGTVYRLGGDEFCALVHAGSSDLERLVRLTTEALTEEGERFRISSSVGTVVVPDETADLTEALKLVDRRMYQNKGGERAAGAEGCGVLLGVLEARDSQLATHTTEVTRLAELLGRELGAHRVPLTALRIAAQLHDIGKVAIPDTILLKPGPLDEEEWRIVRQHTIAGERIVSRVPGLEVVADAIRASHERWDGTGYPDGIAGAEIPLLSRIVAVADAYAAMTSCDRPYRAPRSPEEALAEIVACSGTQFDPEVVDALLAVLRREVEDREPLRVAAL